MSDVNLTIHKGSKIAIVGSNGSGKSTLIKLLLRFYDAASGEILQNGIDIRTYDIYSYRSQFSVAFQDFNIYATSIRNNVCMGDDMDEDRLLDALNKAGLSDSIKDLNAQLTREFDENGILFREVYYSVWHWQGFFTKTAILLLWMSQLQQWMCSLKSSFMIPYLKI